MLVDDAVSFLRRTPPFSLLDDEAFSSLTGIMQMQFYPKGETLFSQDGPVAEHLHVIKSGEVKLFVRTNEGEEVLIDYRGAGDSFGLLSILCGDISRNNVVTTEDTACYLIGREAVTAMMEQHPEVAAFWYRTLLRQLVDLTYTEIHERTLLYGGGDKLLFTNTLNDLATKNVIMASQDISIEQAAGIMADKGISCLVLHDHSELPVGMITDRDLRNKVLAKGRKVTDRVGDIMSIALIKAEARDYCFEALLKMMRYKIHHLLVVGKGQIKGIITNHDLMMLQGTSPLSVAREIETQSTIDGLIPVSKKINTVITLLIKEGAKASNITRIITEINDRLLKRILHITEARLGRPPVRYCWIVYGSEGRKEQTFRTDQDNAIIYEDTKEHAEEAKRYFAEFASAAGEALARCGFPRCPADYMASNPQWCQPLGVWKGYFSKWINQPTPEAILSSLIFFDFRPIYGDVLLAESLRAFLGRELKNKSLFFAHMASIVVKNRPPLDLFKRFRTEGKAGHHGALNIKVSGLCPITDTARLSALTMQIYHTATLERLHELKERYNPISEICDELQQAFEFLMSLRLRHQYQLISTGTEPDNFIRPGDLGRLDRKFLKETFKLVADLQETVKRLYGEGMSV